MPTATASSKTKPTAKAKRSQSAKAQPPAPKVAPCYEIPAIRGIQSNHVYFSIMVPVRLLTKLFHFDHETLPPEMRAQRVLNPSRAKKFCNYVQTAETYTMSSISVTFDPGLEDFNFAPISEGSDIGTLRIPIDSRLFIVDGQHRVEGITISSNIASASHKELEPLRHAVIKQNFLVIDIYFAATNHCLVVQMGKLI